MPEIDVCESSVVDSSQIDGSKDTAIANEEEVQEEWLDVLGSGDLKMKTINVGQDDIRPQTGDICTVRLSAEMEDGTVVESENEAKVELGGSEVIQGLDLIFSLLNVGQKIIAIIKSRFAYGKLGLKPKIPPDATIIYTVELLKIEDAPELTNVSFEDRKKKAAFKKDKGNWWFSRDDGQKAIQCYRAALDVLQESTPYTDEENKVTEMPEDIFREFVQSKMVIHNNLAAAQILINAFDSALVSVDRVIQLDPNNVKALYRRGKILAAQGKCDEAVATFKRAISLDPENAAVKKELAASLKRQSMEKEQAKSLYKKMLGSTAPTDKAEQQSSKSKSYGTSALTKILGATALATLAAGVAFGLGFRL